MTSRNRFLLTASIALSALLIENLSYGADTLTWKGSGGSNWSSAASWSSTGPHTTPLDGDSLVFPANALANFTNTNDTGSVSFPTFTLSKPGSNDYNITSPTIFTINTLTVNSGSPVLNSTMGIPVGGISVNVASGAVLTVTGVISGVAVPLNFTGPGTMQCNANNTYTGTTTINSGTFSIPQQALASQTSIVNNGALIATDILGGSTNTAVSISGSGNFTVNSNCVIGFSGASSYTGATNIQSSALVTATAANRLASTSNFTVNGTLTMSSGNQTIGSLSGSGTVNLGSSTLTTGNSTSTTFSGTISGAGGIVSVNGSGTFTLSGTNTYTGGTNINGSSVSVSAEANLGNSAGAATFVGGGR